MPGSGGNGWGHGHGRGGGWGHGAGRERGGRGGGWGWGAPLEPALLATLATGPRHGYDLRIAVEEMTGSLVPVDPGNLYRLLRRLEDDGLVTSAWAEGSYGPQRRQYQMTAEGREVLVQWREHLRQRAAALRAVVSAIDTAFGHTRDVGTNHEVDPDQPDTP